MKVKIYRSIFLFILVLLLGLCNVLSGITPAVFALDERVLRIYYDDSCFETSLSELGYNGTKFAGSINELASKVSSMGFSDKEIINYIFPNFFNKIGGVLDSINCNAINSTINVETGYPKITTEVVGKIVDENNLYKTLVNQLTSSDGSFETHLKIDEIKPTVCMNDNYKLINEKASFITYINGVNQEGRINNIKRALACFNGYVLNPGEMLSFNNVIGETTKENGYSLAKIILYGKYVDDYGGGVCQAATTLYNAALLAGLDIVEVNPHSLKVGYVKSSFDAMVGGISDLKIANKSDYPVYFHTYATDYECGVKIFGTMNEYDVVRRSLTIEFDQEENPKIQHKSEGFLDYYKDGTLQKSIKIRNDKYYKLNLENN